MENSLKFDELQRSKIASMFIDDKYVITKAICNELEKGKKAAIGEVRTWGGKQFKKVYDGWEPVGGGEKRSKVEEGDVDKKDAQNMANDKKGGASKVQGLGIFNDTHIYQSVRKSETPETLTKNCNKILKSSDTNQRKSIELFKNGLHIHEIVNLTGTPLSATIDYINKAKKQGEFGNATQSSTRTNNDSADENGNTPIELNDVEIPDIPIQARWDSYANNGTMIACGISKSMFAYGSGGVGKTYTLLDEDEGVFSRLKMRKADLNPALDDVSEAEGPLEVQTEDGEDSHIGINPQTGDRFLKKDKYDYIVVSGKLSATRMFELMQEHNGKLIVFDDCDSVLKNDDGVNVLKGALDTTGDGTISWEGKGSLTTGYAGIRGAQRRTDSKGNPVQKWNLPKTFKFNGQIVFISNYKSKNIPQPLRSRADLIDLTMTRQETIDKVESIMYRSKFKDSKGNRIEVTKENREKALHFMQKYIRKIETDDLNMRTFTKIAKQYQFAEQTGQDEQTALSNVIATTFPRKINPND